MADGCACSRGAGLHPLGAADQDALRDEGERSAAGDILATIKISGKNDTVEAGLTVDTISS